MNFVMILINLVPPFPFSLIVLEHYLSPIVLCQVVLNIVCCRKELGFVKHVILSSFRSDHEFIHVSHASIEVKINVLRILLLQDLWLSVKFAMTLIFAKPTTTRCYSKSFLLSIFSQV